MESDELSNKIIQILTDKGKPLTTSELENEVNKAGLQCPDRAVSYLSMLRIKKLIKGKLSIKEKTWLWWI